MSFPATTTQIYTIDTNVVLLKFVMEFTNSSVPKILITFCSYFHALMRIFTDGHALHPTVLTVIEILTAVVNSNTMTWILLKW